MLRAHLILSIFACPFLHADPVMDRLIADHTIVGAHAVLLDKNGTTKEIIGGHADLHAGKKLTRENIYWIASMTKPITGTALMMLAEQGKLSINDPVEKYLPEFKELRDANGEHVTITIAQCMNHSSGLADMKHGEDAAFKTLAELTAAAAKKPANFPPGSRWQYCQSSINTGARVVEVVSGKSFDAWLDENIFKPLHMVDTTFYPTEQQLLRIARSYRRDDDTWQATDPSFLLGKDASKRDRYPRANGGLFSTVHDYSRFARMILNDGKLDDARILTAESVRKMIAPNSGDLVTGFTPGNAWAVGWCIIREPQAISQHYAPGSCGHGGAFGTQCWIDTTKGRAFLLFTQRADFPNSDASAAREALQNTFMAK